MDNEPGPMPEALLRFILEQQRNRIPTVQVDSVLNIPDKVRNTTLTSLAGSMRRRGMREESISSALITENKASCFPPMSEAEVRQIVKSVSRYEPESPVIEICTHEVIWEPPDAPVRSMDDVLVAAEEYLPGCDLGAVRAVLATYIANVLPGPPVNLLIIGGPSSGKTTGISCLEGLPFVRSVDRLTASGLLSSISRAQIPPGKPVGLLDAAGNRMVLLMPELSTVLNPGGKRRSDLFSVLCRACDGKLVVQPGSGGFVRVWTGRLGIIAAVLGNIDRQYDFLDKLGPRFIFVRIRSDPMAVLEVTSSIPAPHEREELKLTFYDAVKGFIAGLVIPERLPRIPAAEATIIQSAGCLTAMARSPIYRDKSGYPLDTDPSEHVHRVKDRLAAMFRAFLVMGFGTEEALVGVTRLAVESISPLIRAEALLALLAEDGPSAYLLCQIISRSETTTGRELEALRLLKLVRCDGSADSSTWNLTPVATEMLERLAPFLDWGSA